jgi:hypothetical protein
VAPSDLPSCTLSTTPCASHSRWTERRRPRPPISAPPGHERDDRRAPIDRCAAGAAARYRAGIGSLRRAAGYALSALALGAGAPVTSHAQGSPASSHGFAGDGGPAELALLAAPTAVAPTPDGGYLIADSQNNRIRRVGPDGIITTVAGNGSAGHSGDGGPATAASLTVPTDVAVAPGGGFLIADTGNDRIRRVAADGTITTLAGNGTPGFAGDGGNATAARLHGPQGVDVTFQGTVLISDTGNDRVREVTADGDIATVAGGGTDAAAAGGLAIGSSLDRPVDVVATPDGFLVADTGHARVRIVSFGVISTIAGTGNPSFTGDGAAGPFAGLSEPTGLAVQRDGSVLIADSDNARVRRLRPRGTLVTVAGNGTPAATADAGSALSIGLALPRGVAAAADGSFLIADAKADRIRRIAPDGTADTIVGRGLASATLTLTGPRSNSIFPWAFKFVKPRATIRPGRARLRLQLTSTVNATFKVTVTKKGHRPRTLRSRYAFRLKQRRTFRIDLGKVTRGVYTIVATATSLDRRTARDKFTLTVKKR